MSFGPPDILAPLTSLLGIRAGMHVSVRNAPKGFLEALLPLPEGAALLDSAKLGLDAIILFTDKKLEVIDQLTRLVTLMSVTGAIWVVFPTGEAPAAPSEDFVRLAGLELGLRHQAGLRRAPLGGPQTPVAARVSAPREAPGTGLKQPVFHDFLREDVSNGYRFVTEFTRFELSTGPAPFQLPFAGDRDHRVSAPQFPGG